MIPPGAYTIITQSLDIGFQEARGLVESLRVVAGRRKLKAKIVARILQQHPDISSAHDLSAAERAIKVLIPPEPKLPTGLASPVQKLSSTSNSGLAAQPAEKVQGVTGLEWKNPLKFRKAVANRSNPSAPLNPQKQRPRKSVPFAPAVEAEELKVLVNGSNLASKNGRKRQNRRKSELQAAFFQTHHSLYLAVQHNDRCDVIGGDITPLTKVDVLKDAAIRDLAASRYSFSASRLERDRRRLTAYDVRFGGSPRTIDRFVLGDVVKSWGFDIRQEVIRINNAATRRHQEGTEAEALPRQLDWEVLPPGWWRTRFPLIHATASHPHQNKPWQQTRIDLLESMSPEEWYAGSIWANECITLPSSEGSQ